jgi:hypothetical protein
MIFFPEKEKFSGNNIDSCFQKCPLGKKCNLNDIFHARKGHFAPGKRALGKTSYAPAYWLALEGIWISRDKFIKGSTCAANLLY